MALNVQYIYLSLLSIIFLLVNCNNYDLYDKLSNPASVTNSGGNGPGGPPITIYLFAPAAANATGGAIGGRSGADSTCVTARAQNTFQDNRCSNVHAVVSISAGDDIASMPNNYGIPANQPVLGPTVGPTQLIAANWSALFTPPLANTFAAAGAVANSWWSFSTTSGTFSASNCSGGISQTGSTYGDTGLASSIGATAINNGTAPACSSTGIYLLCVCY